MKRKWRIAWNQTLNGERESKVKKKEKLDRGRKIKEN
jgi:hypothetical protein